MRGTGEPQDERRKYVGYLPQLLAYGSLLQWHGAADYPTTEAEAKRLAEESLAALPQDALLIGGRVNLREKPSTGSKSQGRYFSGTIGTRLAGGSEGWHHVRIGSVEGYVSSRYAQSVSDYAASPSSLVAMPLPTGVALERCDVLCAPKAGASELAVLPAGERVQVLATVGEDWLHVSLSQPGDPHHQDAVDGYVPARALDVTGYIPD